MREILLFLVAAVGESVKVQHKCGCIPWKDAYASFGVVCGEGNELFTFGPMFKSNVFAPRILPPAMFDEFCTRFFMRGSHNMCLNEKMGSPPTRQWCYVPSGCGGDKLPGKDVEMHNCSASAGDELTSSHSPEMLNTLAKESDLEVGILGKFSYFTSDLNWVDVEQASGLVEEEMRQTHHMEVRSGFPWRGASNATEDHAAELQRSVDSGVATIYDSFTGHGGGTVVWGSKVWGFVPIEENVPPRTGYNGYGYKCVHNCDE